MHVTARVTVVHVVHELGLDLQMRLTGVCVPADTDCCCASVQSHVSVRLRYPSIGCLQVLFQQLHSVMCAMQKGCHLAQLCPCAQSTAAQVRRLMWHGRVCCVLLHSTHIAGLVVVLALALLVQPSQSSVLMCPYDRRIAPHGT
jgi:hypothetical protein